MRPTAWACQVRRTRSFSSNRAIRGIRTVDDRTQAVVCGLPSWMISVAAVVASGDRGHAAELLDRAEETALLHANPFWRVRALARVAIANAEAGRPDHAEHIVHSLREHPHAQTDAKAGIAATIAAMGDHPRAERIAHSTTDPSAQAQILASIAIEVARIGDPEGADRLAHSIADPYWQADALAGVAIVVGESGDRTGATVLAEQAERTARLVTGLTAVRAGAPSRVFAGSTVQSLPRGQAPER